VLIRGPSLLLRQENSGKIGSPSPGRRPCILFSCSSSLCFFVLGCLRPGAPAGHPAPSKAAASPHAPLRARPPCRGLASVRREGSGSAAGAGTLAAIGGSSRRLLSSPSRLGMTVAGGEGGGCEMEGEVAGDGAGKLSFLSSSSSLMFLTSLLLVVVLMMVAAAVMAVVVIVPGGYRWCLLVSYSELCCCCRRRGLRTVTPCQTLNLFVPSLFSKP